MLPRRKAWNTNVVNLSLWLLSIFIQRHQPNAINRLTDKSRNRSQTVRSQYYHRMYLPEDVQGRRMIVTLTFFVLFLLRINTSTRKDQGEDFHRQRIQEKICIGGESRQDQLIDEEGSRSGSSSGEDPGELLHRQTGEGRFGTSTSEDRGEDLHRRRTTAGSPHRRKRIKGWISIGTGSRRSSTSSEKQR